ncbi:hypothetical protein ACROYT_G013894 [Oculina patagonica]
MQLQQQAVAILLIVMRYRQDCLRLIQAIRRRRRTLRNRRFRNRPWSWTLPRPAESWFEIHFNDRTIPGDFFRRQLRMTRDAFQALLRILGHRILSTRCCRVLNELKDEYIRFPETPAETAACIETFENLSLLPNIVGAIDGTHVKIAVPKNSAVDYFSRFQQHDSSIQAVADGTLKFLDVSAGNPGSIHDSRMLRNSTLYYRAEAGHILTMPVVNVNGHDIGPYLVGDSAYPISPWLQKPFPEATRDRREIKFNRELSSARVKIECAFGCLKSRWRILQKRLDSEILFSVKIAIACAVLHNFCIRMGDGWEDNGPGDNDDHDENNDDAVRDGEDIRNILKDFIF